MYEGETIRVHNTASGVKVLGPGKRFVIWVQGCHRRCPGCLAPDSWPIEGGHAEDVSALARRILKKADVEGLTISGGEPFLQPRALCALIDALRAERDLGVIVYTGYTLEALRGMDDAWIRALLERVDLLIDGPYMEALNDDLGLRGSSNQRAIHLTGRYLDALEAFGKKHRRDLEYRVSEEGFFVIGVPERTVQRMIDEGQKGDVGR